MIRPLIIQTINYEAQRIQPLKTSEAPSRLNSQGGGPKHSEKFTLKAAEVSSAFAFSIFQIKHADA